MKFAVTGGAGFVGSHLVEALSDTGHSVIVIDNLKTGKKENMIKFIDTVEFVKGDIRDHQMLKKKLANVDGVFHESALASVPDSFRIPDEYYDVNVRGTENIFRLAKEDGFKVVYASSSSVYGNPIKIPIREDHPRNPINPYAQTKLDDEKLAQKYSEQGASIIGLRYFNIFGERQSKEYAGVIKKFLSSIYKNKAPMINGDGTQTRDFVYVGDVVNANIAAMSSPTKHAFINIGTGHSITIFELAKMIIKESGLAVSPDHRSALEGDIKESVADTSLAKKLLGWTPKVTLNDWLKVAIPAKIN
jgi:UDP-glucose 4-epimerase